MAKSKHKQLLDDVDISRWYNNLKRSSECVVDVALRRLGRFCEITGISPKQLVQLNDTELKNTLMDFVTKMEENNYAGSYIDGILKHVKSWLNYNERTIKVKIKIKDARNYKNTINEKVPSQEELKIVLQAADNRARTAISLIAFSGIRLEVLGNYRGTDGLKIRDFPEMIIQDGEVIFEREPTMVVVRSELSKAKHQYFTFLGKEGCMALKMYLEERLRNGEDLHDDSAIITPIYRNMWGKHISTINIGDIIRKAIRNAGFNWRPYVFRHYFDTQLLLAKSKKLVVEDYRVFWMGHKGNIENHYTTNKNTLPEEIVEDMRESYSKCLQFLETDNYRESLSMVDKIKSEYRKIILSIAGFSDEEISEIDLLGLDEDEFLGLVRDKLLNHNEPVQKVVTVEEAEELLNNGWIYITTLPNNKIVVRRD